MTCPKLTILWNTLATVGFDQFGVVGDHFTDLTQVTDGRGVNEILQLKMDSEVIVIVHRALNDGEIISNTVNFDLKSKVWSATFMVAQELLRSS